MAWSDHIDKIIMGLAMLIPIFILYELQTANRESQAPLET